jgi:hypothetical protein
MHYPSVDEEDDRFQNEVEQFMRNLDEQPDPWCVPGNWPPKFGCL